MSLLKEKPNWKRIIDEKEKRERDELEAKFRSDWSNPYFYMLDDNGDYKENKS